MTTFASDMYPYGGTGSIQSETRYGVEDAGALVHATLWSHRVPAVQLCSAAAAASAIMRALSAPAATACAPTAGRVRRLLASYSVPMTPPWSVGCSSNRTGQPFPASAAA